MPGLTLTIITHRASSLNYGENIGNVSVLKKLTLGDNKQITYISDKALKYDMKRCGKEMFGWKLLDEKTKEKLKEELKKQIEEGFKRNTIDVEKSSKGRKGKGKQKDEQKIEIDTDELSKNLVKEYVEFDLFGGLFTKDLLEPLLNELTKENEENKKNEYELSGDAIKRTSVVKVSYAFSVNHFKSDTDFMNNIDLYNRCLKHIGKDQAIALSEQHTSHYIYTVTIDLDRVGAVEVEKEGKSEVEVVVDKEERIKRVENLLDVIMALHRHIRGRPVNLSPIFVVGGVFSVKNPFFIDSVEAEERDGKLKINLKMLKDAIKLVDAMERVLKKGNKGNNEVLVGICPEHFHHNEEEIKKELSGIEKLSVVNVNVTSVDEVFERLKEKVRNIL